MHRALFLVCLFLMPTLAVPAVCDAQTTPPNRVAPTRLYPEPPIYLLLRLSGDRTTIYYTPGSLDRAANLQQRLERVTRGFERWADRRLDLKIFLLSRREWEEAGISVPYGVPVRAGAYGILAPARGDTETVELWLELLDGRLPNIVGTPVLGSPEELASLVMADVLVQLLAGEILVDSLGLAGDAPWVRPLMTQLAALTAVQRAGTDRPEDLAVMWGQLAKLRPPRSFAVTDYSPDLSLVEWLAFEARLHGGARVIYDKLGKKSIEKMIDLRKKGDGTISADHLESKVEPFSEWLRETFTAVSRRP